MKGSELAILRSLVSPSMQMNWRTLHSGDSLTLGNSHGRSFGSPSTPPRSVITVFGCLLRDPNAMTGIHSLGFQDQQVRLDMHHARQRRKSTFADLR